MAKELKAVCDDLRVEIRAELREFRDTVERELRKELRDIKASLTFINKMYKDTKSELATVRSENKNLKSDNVRLQSTCEALEKQVKSNSSRLLHCEQYSRNANIEIKGVPPQATENLTQLLIKLGEVSNEPITASDIEVCHRVPVAGKPSEKNIVVQFTHRSKRNALLEKTRRLRLTATDLGVNTQVPVFVNKHLCPELKKLLGQTTSRKREQGWRYVWVRNGQIYARKTEDSSAVKVSSTDDLAKITSD